MKICEQEMTGRYPRHWCEGHVNRGQFARELRRVLGCDRAYVRGIRASARHAYDAASQPVTICDHTPPDHGPYLAVQSWDEHVAEPYLAVLEEYEARATTDRGEVVRRYAAVAKDSHRHVKARFLRDLRRDGLRTIGAVCVSLL